MNQEFLEALFPDLKDEFIEVRLIHSTNKPVQTHFYSSIKELIAHQSIIDECSKSFNIYFGVCPRSKKEGNKQSVKIVWCLWADLDAKDFTGGKQEILDRLKSFPIPPTIVVDSGNGFHVYWRLKEAFAINTTEDITKIEAYLKALCQALNGDQASAELARVLRLPGTLNHRNPESLKPVILLEFNPDQQCNLGDFDLILPFPSQPNSEKINPAGWIAQALYNMKEGNRNAIFAKIIGRLHRDGLTPEEILALLSPHAQQRAFPLEELKKEIEGICERYPNDSPFPFSGTNSMKTETENSPFICVKLSDFLLQSPPQISWVVENLLPQESVGILAGLPGYGKSWMMLDLAIECARGGKWLGQFNTTAGTVLYVDEESAAALLNRRLNKLLNGKDVSRESLDVHFALGQGLCLNDRASVDRLRGQIETLKPKLVIVDSLIRVHRAEENSAKEMAQVSAVIQKIFREYKCTFLFADHQRKPSNFSVGSDQLLRGSSEKLAFVDSLLSLKRKDKFLIVEHSKSRYVPEIPSFMVDIKDLSPEITQVIYSGEAEAHLQTERLKTVGDFLESALMSGQWISRKDLVEKAKQIQISERVVDGVLKNYVDSGLIEREDRKLAQGSGGKSAFYRRKTDSFSLQDNEGEIEIKTEERNEYQ